MGVGEPRAPLQDHGEDGVVEPGGGHAEPLHGLAPHDGTEERPERICVRVEEVERRRGDLEVVAIREGAVPLHHDRLVAVGQTVSDALERAPRDEQLQMRPSSLTASRSSTSSATLASMRAAREVVDVEALARPTTCRRRTSHGNEEMRPSATP